MFYCYILRCSDNTLYTGYTNDLDKRLKAHNSGNGAKYTKFRRPCVMVYYESYDNKHDAMSREYYVKHCMSRADKLKLIEK